MTTATAVPARPLDPRVLRTRGMLHCALARLLATRPFGSLSIQEIADAAGVNRVTFYNHYTDKLDLLNGMVATRFAELLAERNVSFDGCSSALTEIARAVCDFLASAPGGASAADGETERHLESALVAVVRRMLLEGLRLHPPAGEASAEMVAAAVSWAIYGAAREWVTAPDRASAEQTAGIVARMVVPLMHA